MKENKIKGITLVALVVTIIILLIISGVSISLIAGEDGLFAKANSAVTKYKEASQNEQAQLSELLNSKYLQLATSGTVTTISQSQLEELITTKVNQILSTTDTTSVGTIIAYMGSTAPTDYLACNGAVLNVSDYPELYEVLKTLDHTGWATADWTTKFSLPDLRGEFLRGTGTATRETGSGTSIGKHQDPTSIALGRITNNSFSFRMGTSDYNENGVTELARNTDKNISVTGTSKSLLLNFDNNNDATILVAYQTIRPTNTSVLYCIKAK